MKITQIIKKEKTSPKWSHLPFTTANQDLATVSSYPLVILELLNKANSTEFTQLKFCSFTLKCVCVSMP